MDLNNRLALSYYKTICTINDTHKITLVQHQETNKIYVKKVLDVYNSNIYEQISNVPVKGTPKIIQCIEDDNQLTVIEEYISGDSLEEKIANHSITQNDISIYLKDLCEILSSLHSMNPAIIHRDIKPSNIIITSCNHAILLDFNAAKSYSSSSLEDTVLLGTQGYAAPEQFGFGASSQATDIYSVGIVLKEMVNSLSEPYHELDYIIEKCTQLTPKNRFSSVEEILDLLSKNASNHCDSQKSTIRKFLPPGYRTKTPWKILLASVGYTVIFYLCLTLQATDRFGVDLWLNRLCCLSIFLLIIFGCFNYLGIQRHMPFNKNPNRLLRYLGIAIFEVVFSSILLMILVTIELIYFTM